MSVSDSVDMNGESVDDPGCYIVLSDIHGNLQAYDAVIADINDAVRRRIYTVKGVFLLGDIIDYGMSSNAVVESIRGDLSLRWPVKCNIWGNHERAVMLDDYERFSSERGVLSAKYTASVLTDATRGYLSDEMVHEGYMTCDLEKRILLVHGSLKDPYWGSVTPEDVQDSDGNLSYADYDVVFSGHSHVPHVFTKLYPCEDKDLRGKKPTVFINPGSVGQPRNRNPLAQYAVWDPVTGETALKTVRYDMDGAMSLYHGQVDDFYRDRLVNGV